MTWENTKRARAKVRQRRGWHENRIAAAPTSKQQLSAACQWLISEAWQAGRVTEVLGWVRAKVDEIHEKEAKPDDRDDHRA